MNILITGAQGFVGKNLVASFKNIQDGKDQIHKIKELKNPSDLEIYCYDKDSTLEELEYYCSNADFIFNLAGVNRPKEQSEYMDGNFGFATQLLNTLKKYNNTCPIMLSSSIQATLLGRYAHSEYGKSKLAGEELFFNYSKETGAKVLIYRFPNLFGKWCKPNYNSVVATFCNNIAKDLPIQVDNRNIELELLYIDDLIEEMILILNGREHHCEFDGLHTIEQKDGKYCYVPMSYHVTLGKIIEHLEKFKEQPNSLLMPKIPYNSFEKKLYSTYLSYLPKEKIKIPLKMNQDIRGSFTELIKTFDCGQFSVNISKPNITKGQHWHHSKWELFIVVSGHALIQEREIGSDEILEFEVSGDKIEAIYMLPGYTHNIINLSNTKDLVTIMWANEAFDPKHPDTFFEIVE